MNQKYIECSKFFKEIDNIKENVFKFENKLKFNQILKIRTLANKNKINSLKVLILKLSQNQNILFVDLFKEFDEKIIEFNFIFYKFILEFVNNVRNQGVYLRKVLKYDDLSGKLRDEKFKNKIFLHDKCRALLKLGIIKFEKYHFNMRENKLLRRKNSENIVDINKSINLAKLLILEISSLDLTFAEQNNKPNKTMLFRVSKILKKKTDNIGVSVSTANISTSVFQPILYGIFTFSGFAFSSFLPLIDIIKSIIISVLIAIGVNFIICGLLFLLCYILEHYSKEGMAIYKKKNIRSICSISKFFNEHIEIINFYEEIYSLIIKENIFENSDFDEKIT